MGNQGRGESYDSALSTIPCSYSLRGSSVKIHRERLGCGYSGPRLKNTTPDCSHFIIMEKRYCKLCGEETNHVFNEEVKVWVCGICQLRSSS